MVRPTERKNTVTTSTDVQTIYSGVTDARQELTNEHKTLDQVIDEVRHSDYRTLTLSLTEGAVELLDTIAPRGTRTDGEKYSKKQIVTEALVEYLQNHYKEHENVL